MKRKIRFEKQLDTSDCGLVCLKMICSIYGKDYSLSYLRSIIHTGKDGVSLLEISKASEILGFKTSGGLFAIEDFEEKVDLPCILHWNQNHFVVLYDIIKKGGAKYYYVADPGKGLLKYKKEDIIDSWEIGTKANTSIGVALLFDVTNQFHKNEVDEINKQDCQFKFLFSYFIKHKKFFLQLILGLLVGSVLQLIFPFLLQSIVDVGIGNKDINFIWLILIAQFILITSSTAIDFIRRHILLHISTRINVSLISDFFIKLMKLPMSFFDSKLMGDIIQRIEDHKRIENFLINQSLTLLFSLFSFVVFSIVLLVYNKYIFIVFVIGSVLYGLWILLFLKKRRILDYRNFEQQGIDRSKTYQLINGMQEIKLQGLEKQKRWEWEDTQADLFEVKLKTLSLQQSQGAGSLFINQIKNLIITVMSATSVINGDISVGMMLSIQYIIGQLNSPIEQIIGFIYQWQDVNISLERMSEIHNKPNEENKNRDIVEINSNSSYDIVFNKVSFSYEGYSSRLVLRNVDLIIPSKKVTAIVGASGSGKTTLLKLLLGYYEPSTGSIEVAGLSLNSFNLTWWRSICGAVMQDGYIFSDSIARNIITTDGGIDRYKLKEAAKIANINNYIEKLPLKYNTIVGQEGQGLSQGQKQRLLIARAVYKDPDFLFLDEATNALDANNEKEIIENLDRFYKNKTVIIIAHRLSTVKNADQIVVLDNGAIVEQGNHEFLTSKRGKYYQLVKNQLELGS